MGTTTGILVTKIVKCRNAHMITVDFDGRCVVDAKGDSVRGGEVCGIRLRH